MSDESCALVQESTAPKTKTIADGCPPSVLLACEFVEMCLDRMQEQREETALMAEDDQEHSVEMNPKQQAVFELACNLIGTYFTTERNRIGGE